jgi:hypothetical protein
MNEQYYLLNIGCPVETILLRRAVLVVASKAVSSTNWAKLFTAVSTMGSFRFRAQSRAHDSKRATDMASVHDLSLGMYGVGRRRSKVQV